MAAVPPLIPMNVTSAIASTASISNRYPHAKKENPTGTTGNGIGTGNSWNLEPLGKGKIHLSSR